MKLILRKLPGGMLAPAEDETAEELNKVKTGSIVHGNFTRMRNYEFHKKFFALVGLAYDIWCETLEPQEYKGQPVLPNQDRFRHDLTILAGFYDATYTIKGEVRLQPKSISFASMDQDEFEKLFSRVLDVVLRKVLTNTNYDEATLRARVDEIMRFDQ